MSNAIKMRLPGGLGENIVLEDHPGSAGNTVRMSTSPRGGRNLCLRIIPEQTLRTKHHDLASSVDLQVQCIDAPSVQPALFLLAEPLDSWLAVLEFGNPASFIESFNTSLTVPAMSKDIKLCFVDEGHPSGSWVPAEKYYVSC